MAFETVKSLVDRIRGKAKTSPAGTFAAMSDWGDLYWRYGRPVDYDQLFKAVLIEPTANLCVYLPANDLAQVPLRVYRRTGSNDTIAEQLGLKQRRKMMRQWERHGSRSVKAKMSQIGEDFEEVTDPTDPVVALINNPNPRQTAFSYMRQLIINRRTAGGVFEVPIMSGGIPVQLETVNPKYMRAELDTTYGTLIREWVAHRNGRDLEHYAPDELIVYGTQNPDEPGKFVSALASCINEVYLLWNITTARTAMMANGGHPGGFIESTKGLDETQRRRLEEEFAKRFAGPEAAGYPMVLEPGLIYRETSSGKELDWNASVEALQDTVLRTMGIPNELLDTKDANLAGAQEASPEYARRTLLPLAREIEDERNERLIPMFGEGFEDYVLAFDDMVGEDMLAEMQVRQLRAQTYVTVNELRAEDGLEPIEGGNVVLGLQQQAAAADPFAGLFGKQLDELQAAVKALTLPAPDDEELTITVREPDQKAATDSNEQKQVIRDVDVLYGGVELPGCKCESCRPPRNTKEADIDETAIYKQNAAVVAELADEWYQDTLMDAGDLLASGGLNSGLSRSAFIEAAATRFLEDVSEPLLDVFSAGYTEGGTEVAGEVEEADLGAFAVPSDRAGELYRRHRLRLAEDVSSTAIRAAENAVDGIVDQLIEQGLDEGLRRDEISKLLAEKVPGISRSRAETIARTEVANAQLMGRLEAWKDSEFVEGKQYLLSSDPCFICKYVANKLRGRPTLKLDEPFLKAGESIPNGTNPPYVVTRDIMVPPSHPRCRCSMAAVMVETEAE